MLTISCLANILKEYVQVVQKVKDLCLDKYTHYHQWFLHHRAHKFNKLYAGNLSVFSEGVCITLEVELFHGCIVMEYSDRVNVSFMVSSHPTGA